MLQQKRLVHGGEEIRRPEMRKELFFVRHEKDATVKKEKRG